MSITALNTDIATLNTNVQALIAQGANSVPQPTGHIVAFSDQLSPAEFDKAAKAAWKKIKEQY